MIPSWVPATLKSMSPKKSSRPWIRSVRGNHHRSRLLPDRRRYLQPVFDRYTGSHQRHGGCTDTCLGSRTVGLEGLGYGTDCVRELFLGRKYRNQGTFCQSTMADLTGVPVRGTVLSHLQSRREVVLMHVTFGGSRTHQSVQFLCFGKRSQCCYVADLESVHG